jgi:hypothetical protein
MTSMIGSLLAFCLSFLRTSTQVRLENLFLRKQLEIVARSSQKQKFKPEDRLFLGLTNGLFDSWRNAAWIVKPGTVIRWHRQSRTSDFVLAPVDFQRLRPLA